MHMYQILLFLYMINLKNPVFKFLTLVSFLALSLMAWFGWMMVARMFSTTSTSFFGIYVPVENINNCFYLRLY